MGQVYDMLSVHFTSTETSLQLNIQEKQIQKVLPIISDCNREPICDTTLEAESLKVNF